MNTLPTTKKYYNKYEMAYDMAKKTHAFRQNDWDTFAKRGELDEYLGVLSESEKLPLNFYADKHFDILDTDNRFMAMSNELFGDRVTEKDREEIVFNDKTGKEETLKYKMTDYDYINKLLDDRIKYEQKKILRNQEQERKDNMNGFVKFLGDIGAVGTEMAMGATDIVQDLTSLLEGVYDGFDNLINDTGTFEDGFRKAFDTSENGGSDWRVFDNLGFKDAIMNFERKYTDLRDIDGNYTTAGKYIGGVASSLGKALPTIGLNLIGSGIVKSGSAAATNIAKASTAIYYTGMGAGEFREMATNPSFASVPTVELMTNATVRTVTEFLIQKGVSKAFGPTQLDKMMFGETQRNIAGKISAMGGINRIIKDFVAEGTEEFLQQYSNWVVDRFFAIGREQFASNSEWNLQTMFDAFVIGGLSTIGGNLFSLGKSMIKDSSTLGKINKLEKKVKNNTITEKESQELAELKRRPKMNFLESWNYKNNVSELVGDYNTIMNNKSLTNEQRMHSVGQMYSTFRTLADVYGDIGKDRFVAAQNMLKTMSDMPRDTDNKNYAKSLATVIIGNARRLGNNTISNVDQEKLQSELEDAKITNVAAVIQNPADDTLVDEALANIDKEDADSIKDTINTLKDTMPEKRFILTTDGINIVSFGDIVFLPIEYALVDDGNMITKTFNEQRLVKEIANTKEDRIASILISLTDVFEKCSNRKNVPVEEVVYNLLFNDSFFRIALSSANTEIFQFLSHLDSIEKNVRSKSVADDIYKKKIADARERIGIALTQYLVLQQNVSYNDLTMLSDKQIRFIRQHRTEKDLANRIIRGEKLTTDDLALLRAKINSLPISDAEKQDIRAGLGYDAEWNIISSSTMNRRNALYKIDEHYYNVFFSPYDNKTYLEERNSVANSTFNIWLKDGGLTLRDIIKASAEDRKIYQDLFNEYSNGAYSLEFINNFPTITTTNLKAPIGYTDYTIDRSAIRSGGELDSERTIVNETRGRAILSKLINKNVGSVMKGFITLTDLINEPSLLPKTIQDRIKEEHTVINPNTTFVTLRDYVLDKTGNLSIDIRKDGTFSFVDLTPMNEALISPDISAKTLEKDTERGNIKNFVSEKFLPKGSSLRDIKVKLVDGNNTSYIGTTNTIEISKRYADDAKGFRFALLHEFQHAIQLENRLNGGLNKDWPSLVAEKDFLKIVNDVREHRPDLFENILRGTTREKEIVRNFIYDTTGEQQAYGLEGSFYSDFYPTIINNTPDGSFLITPWGTQYSLLSLNVEMRKLSSMQNIMSLAEDESINQIDDELEMTEQEKRRQRAIERKNKHANKEGALRFSSNEFDVAPRVRIGKSKSSNLKAYRNKLLDIRVKEFIENVDLENLTVEVADMIENGTFNLREAAFVLQELDYLNKTDNYTFDMLNKYIYKNKYITSLEELESRSLVSTKENPKGIDAYYAAMKIILDDNLLPVDIDTKLKVLNAQDPEGFVNLINSFNQKVPTREAFEDYKLKFSSFGRPVSQKDIKTLLMKEFDGSIASGAEIARKAVNNTFWEHSGRSISTTKTDITGSDRMLETGSEEEGYKRAIISEEREIQQRQVEMYELNLLNLDKPDMSLGEINSAREEIESRLDDMNDDELRAYFLQVRYERDIQASVERRIRAKLTETYKKDNPTATQRTIDRAIEKKVESMVRERMADIKENEILNMTDEEIQTAILKSKINRLEIYKLKQREEYKRATDAKKAKYRNAVKAQVDALDSTSILEYAAKNSILKLIYREAEKDLENMSLRTEMLKSSVTNITEAQKTEIEHLQRSISRYATSIVNRLSEDEWKKVPDEYKELFTPDHALRKELYYTRKRLDKEATEKAEGGNKIYESLGKSLQELKELQKKLRQLSINSRSGMYRTKKLQQQGEQLKKAKSNLKIERTALKESKKRIEALESEVKNLNNKLLLKSSGGDLEVKTEKPAPDVLKPILKTEFSKLSKSQTKYLTATDDYRQSVEMYVSEHNEKFKLEAKDIDSIVNIIVNPTLRGKEISLDDFIETLRDKRHLEAFVNLTKKDITHIYELYTDDIKNRIKEGENNVLISGKEFISLNAENLSQIEKTDVDDIIDYYAGKISFAGSEESMRLFSSIRVLVFGYIIENQKGLELTNEQLDRIRQLQAPFISTGATIMSVWRNVLKKIDPTKTVIESLAEKSGVTFSEDDKEILESAVKAGDVKEIIALKDRLLEEAIENSKDEKSFWDKAWDVERMFMLSSPGTWIRNQVSDVGIWLGNNLGSVIGKLFPKTKKGYDKLPEAYRKQFKITGTKTTTEVKNFLDRELFDKNGFVDNVLDSLSKYDDRPDANIKDEDEESEAAEMILNSIRYEVFNYPKYSEKHAAVDKTLSTMSKFLRTMLSDNMWIKTRAKSYLGKILTEDDVNINNGITHDILSYLAKAYKMAAYDYMRKPNIITKMEATLRQEGGSGAFFLYKQIFPFAGAAWNWFIEGLKYTPAGLATGIYRLVKLENTVERMEKARARDESSDRDKYRVKGLDPRFAEYLARRDIGKGVIGSLTLAIGLLLGLTRVAKIDDEQNKRYNKILLKIRDDVSIDISEIFGTQGVLLGIVLGNAVWKETPEGKEFDIKRYTDNILNTFVNNSLLSDIYDTFQFGRSPADYLKETPNRMLNMFIPNFIKGAWNLIGGNSQRKYMPGLLGKYEKTLASAVPGLVYAMPKRYDPYTGEIKSKHKLPFLIDFINLLSPIKIKDADMSSDELEAIRIGVRKGELTGRYQDIGNLDRKDIVKLNKKYGELNAQTLKNLKSNKNKFSVEMPDGTYKRLRYSEMSDKQKKRITERLMDHNALYAKVFIFTKNGGKYYAEPADYRALKKLGIVTNVYRKTRKLDGFVA